VTRPWLQRTPPNNEAASARSSLKMQPQISRKLQQSLSSCINISKMRFKSRRVLDLESKENPKRSNATKALAPANEVPTAYIFDFNYFSFMDFEHCKCRVKEAVVFSGTSSSISQLS